MAYQTEIYASIKMFTDKQSLINTYIKQEGKHDIKQTKQIKFHCR